MMLNKGDKVAFVAPSGCIDPNSLDLGKSYLEKLGLEVEIMPHVYDACRYMAGTDSHRADDINESFRRSDIKALFCVRGGAGSTKMLDKVDYSIVKNNPKPVFGLSDSTALQNALYTKAGNVSYTGFLPIFDFKNGDLAPLTASSLENVFANRPYLAEGGKTLVGGKSEGVVVGGCLSVLCYLCGTPYFPDLKGKIILIEDIGEKSYKLELMLNQLKQQDGFSQIKGIIFGKFVNCVVADEEDGTIEQILTEFASGLNVPVISDFLYGHIQGHYILPIGAKVVLDADKGTVEIG